MNARRAVIICLLSLVLAGTVISGCGAPGQQKVVGEAIEWIEKADCQAIAKGTGAQWWLYGDEGRSTVGVGGSLMIDGNTVYVRNDPATHDGEGPAAPQWLRFSREDFPDAASVDDEATRALLLSIMTTLWDPLLAMETMVTEGDAVETADGTAWVVTGRLEAVKLLERLIGEPAALRWVELNPTMGDQRAVTLTVSKETGRPLEMTIETIPGSSVDAVAYTFTRGIWAPWSNDTISLDDFLDQNGER